MFAKRLLPFFVCSLVIIFGGYRANAQATTSLGGTVTDKSGAVIPGANVTLTLAATRATRTNTTNSKGEFQFSQLPPGRYDLAVSAEGFGPGAEEWHGPAGEPARDGECVTLAIASVTAQVNVTSDVQPVLNTTDATLGNAFDSQQVESLPIEGRNVPDLLSLQPGVTYLGRTDDNNGTNAVGNNSSDSRSGAVNGGRSDQSNITLDGVDVNDINNGYAFTSVLRVTQDSVAEFRVTTSNPNAEEGRSSGAQVALVTKSGGNQFHGAVYEYNRSNFLEANDFFNKTQQIAAGLPNVPPKLIRNIFGGRWMDRSGRTRLSFLPTTKAAAIRKERASMRARCLRRQYRAGNLQYDYVTWMAETRCIC